MAKAFFNGWELWEKMCFVLACAIVLTILAGCVKLAYSRRRIRKYTALAEANKASLEEAREDDQTNQSREPDIPFGIRAIESGIEVDGVWISRSGTPANGSLFEVHAASGDISSPMDSSPAKSNNSTSASTSPFIPKPVRSHVTSSGSHPTQIPAVMIPMLGRRSPADDAAIQPVTPIPSLESPHKPRFSFHRRHIKKEAAFAQENLDSPGHQGNQLESSGSRTESSALLGQDLELDNIDLEQGQRNSYSTDHSPERADPRSSTFCDQGKKRFSEIAPKASDKVPTPLMEIRQSTDVESQGDLQSLHQHRLLHVAEAGRVHPRPPSKITSGGWYGLLPSRNGSSKVKPREDSALRPGSAVGESTLNSGAVTSPSIRVGSVAPKSEALPGTTKARQEDRGQEPPPPQQQQTLAALQSGKFPLHQNKTIRKINSAFEVLPAGTFSSISATGDLESSHGERPGVSKQKKSKKLQKKNTLSSKPKNSALSNPLN
ncbi:MAG: hypothetical protein M1837_004356 [Sclerophora amabilis]|nr:MAG: hypothetical protein M1837_004356 [Sclerophora amabilis]